MAAPFIVPSTATICLAVSSWRFAIASCEASSPRVTLAARVPNCLTASLAASVATVAVRLTREVGIFWFSRGMYCMLRAAPAEWQSRDASCVSGGALHARSRHDVVGSVSPAHPRLRAAVVVVTEQHQGGGLAERRARLRALGVEPAPHADE